MNSFSRSELQNIREKAIASKKGVINPQWNRAYDQLADAADRIDAMKARLETRGIDSEEIM